MEGMVIMLELTQEKSSIQTYFEEYIKNGDRKALINALTPILNTKTLVMHVAAPKSGSTWFDKIIQQTRKFKFTTLVHDYERREQEIQLEVFIKNIIDVNERVYFNHQHLRASEYVIEFINYFDIKVILQIRNIFDTVLSIRDHLLKLTRLFPMMYVTDDFYDLSEEEQLNMIIDLFIPWYFNFYVSWFQHIDHKNIYILQYEKLIENTLEEVSNIYDWLKIDYKKDDLREFISRSHTSNKTRKNVGIKDRGNLLTDIQHNRIINYSKYYKSIDFSLIGINYKK